MPRHSPYALYSLNSFVLVLYKLLFAIYCLSFVSIILCFGLFLSIVKKLCFLLSWVFFHLDIVSLTCKAYFVLANCSYPRFLERPFCYWLKLIFILKTVFLNYLFVLLYLLYSVFNEHLRAKHFCVLLVGSNGLEPSTSRLSGARSSHLSYEPIVSRFRFLCPRGTYSAFLSALSVPWWRWWD